MPSLGADMEAGTLVEWMVQPGDRVKRGDIIAAVETEKGIIEVEVFEDGLIERLVVEPGAEVPVGTILAMINSDGMPTPALEAGQLQARPLSEPAGAAPGHRVRASPLARRLAAQLGIDLNTIEGTGPHGAIERTDVERAAAHTQAEAAATQPLAPQPVSADVQAGMRRAIAAAMSRSNREIPHYYLETRIDMSCALRWLEAQNQQRSIKDRLLPPVLLLKAVACALGDVPELNAYWLDDRHQLQDAIHIGFAIALRQGGLVTPALHDVHLKDVDELMAMMRDLIMRARAGRLRSSEMTDATITVTNLGDLGVETVFGVIYPPQVAIIGFGKIMEQPWAEQGMLGVRPVLTATLAADHRATDGRRGAQFLEVLNHYLQEVERL
ncbi:MAG: branched-chain alpha-keto acid dehydrogenase subunit E2 [Candidatus Entotheonella gemina]|uniref:Dihydrolipoamide acetyltransferase component of pyruvate dehydrogenase complex n=2 Tax=Candidatus Entotheonella TaxID=93171 RepID=W4MA20_9BACT|nr:MAG: branched-chain alpha-keto acid dehydrogenase subunit E2 [Candidatus Entotheonella gemina]